MYECVCIDCCDIHCCDQPVVNAVGFYSTNFQRFLEFYALERTSIKYGKIKANINKREEVG